VAKSGIGINGRSAEGRSGGSRLCYAPMKI
jgi:hypothetical protein